MIPSLLASPAFFGLGIPIIFLFAGALAKKLVRRSGGWKQADFFLGIEATLAAMSSGVVNIFDLVRDAATQNHQIEASRLAATGSFLAINFFLLLVLLSIHQDWELPTADKRRQFFWLGVVSNTVGLALMGCFIVAIKGLH